jgi:hypothetical protein
MYMYAHTYINIRIFIYIDIYQYMHLHVLCTTRVNLISLLLQYSHNEERSWMTLRTSTTPSPPLGSATCSRNFSL